MLKERILWFERLIETMDASTTNRIGRSRRNGSKNLSSTSTKKTNRDASSPTEKGHKFRDILEIKRPSKGEPPSSSIEVDFKLPFQKSAKDRPQKNASLRKIRTLANSNQLSTSMRESNSEGEKSRSTFYQNIFDDLEVSKLVGIFENTVQENYVNKVVEQFNRISFENTEINNISKLDKDQNTIKLPFVNNKKEKHKTNAETLAGSEGELSINNNSVNTPESVVVDNNVEEVEISAKIKNTEELKTIVKTQSKPPKTNEEHDKRVENSHLQEDFGLTDFDENDDNFIVETFNRDDYELCYLSLIITRTNYNEVTKELINGADKVFQLQDDNSVKMLKNEDDNQENTRQSYYTDDSGIADCGWPSMILTQNEEFSAENPIEDIIDTQGNLRIQRISSQKEHEYSTLTVRDPQIIEKNRRCKLSYIIDELLRTEEKYVDGLRKIVFDYKPYIEENVPIRLIGKTAYIFGNIHAIYNESQTFLNLLNAAGTDVHKISHAFISNTHMFQLYPKYSKNKPIADNYIKEFDQLLKKRQDELGERLDLASYLLTPIQRLGKYILILESMEKELDKKKLVVPNIRLALEMIRTQMKRSNDSIAINSIKKCPIDLLGKGLFIMRGKFTIIKPKKAETMMFLFEDIVIFTQISPKNLEEFIYIDSIEMNDLTIATYEEDPLIFHLVDFPKCRRGRADQHTYIIEAKTPKSKYLWTGQIINRLWDQLEKARKHQKKIHDAEGKRYSHADLPKKASNMNKKRAHSETRLM